MGTPSAICPESAPAPDILTLQNPLSRIAVSVMLGEAAEITSTRGYPRPTDSRARAFPERTRTYAPIKRIRVPCQCPISFHPRPCIITT